MRKFQNGNKIIITNKKKYMILYMRKVFFFPEDIFSKKEKHNKNKKLIQPILFLRILFFVLFLFLEFDFEIFIAGKSLKKVKKNTIIYANKYISESAFYLLNNCPHLDKVEKFSFIYKICYLILMHIYYI